VLSASAFHDTGRAIRGTATPSDWRRRRRYQQSLDWHGKAIRATPSGWTKVLLLKADTRRRTSAVGGARRDQHQARRIEPAEDDSERCRADGSR
jgi:hypothetical protein